MQESEFNQGLLDFLGTSPTPFHAVTQMTNTLEKAGFVRLGEDEVWELKKGGRYYVIRNASSIIAFTQGRTDVRQAGIRMVGAHTDSPCLKVKPQPEQVTKCYLQLGVEVYGGALYSPWFDRDLSLAGRVSYLSKSHTVKNAAIDFKRAIAFIPSLAIHLDREVNKKHEINAQKELPPILLQVAKEESVNFREILLEQLRKEYPGSNAESVLDYELYLYDTQTPSLVGLNRDFIAGARLDNLMSCYIGLMSVIEATEDVSGLLVCNDHEEVGSASTVGAQGPFLKSVLQRICPVPPDLFRTIDHSMMISTDNAHGIHPNYMDKYDGNHGPILNRGPVIKTNANQRYASNSETTAVFRYLCQKADVPVQDFVMRSDMVCGSTIGPLTASEIGVKTLDVGIPTFGMHSIRELAGGKDGFYLYRVLRDYFQMDALPFAGT